MHELPTTRRITAYPEGLHSFLSGQQRSIVLTACRGKPLSVSWLLGRVASFAPMYRACYCGGRAICVSDRCFRALHA